MIRYCIALIMIFQTIVVTGQSCDATPPVHYPTPSNVWEFTKFGDTGINEYRGLANISIPLHTVKSDDVQLPLTLDYYTGGIRVSEDPGIVGLGWSMNLPTLLQEIKDKNDYDFSTNHQKLPPYQGNPALPSEAVYPPAMQYTWSEDVSGLQTLVGVQDIPYYKNVAQSILIDNNGYYNTGTQAMGKYQAMFQNTFIVDSEPDIFTARINGDELKFCREESNRAYIDNSNFQLLPVKIIKGNIGYKITLIPNTAPNNLTNPLKINGFIITDLGGNQYYFDKYEKYKTNNSVSSIVYRLTKIITLQGKSIVFSYSEITTISESSKFDIKYSRRNGTTTNGDYGAGGSDILNTYNISNPSYCGGFEPQIVENYCPLTTTINYDYSFLTSIVTEQEKIILSYSARTDNAAMKKLDSIEIQNIFNQKVKKYDFSYDYFISTDNSTKRLKLLQLKEEGNQPYVFSYNATQLPKKDSFSIDYWGLYNGSSKLNLKLNLAVLGYPQYTENQNNNFNSSLNFVKACTLEKITYPTKGYTVYEYELHEFDNLIEYRGGQTPIINSGAGLRISYITNYNFDTSIISRKKYTYSGGKCINKRVLTKEVTERHGQPLSNGWMFSTLNTPCIITSFNNFVNQSLNSEGDFIGYDKITIKNEGAEDIGKIEKVFTNKVNTTINPYSLLFTDAMNYSNKIDYENGKLLSETYFNSSNLKVLEKVNSYFNVIQAQNTYGMRIQSNGLKFFSNLDINHPETTIFPRKLATFYPIYGKTTFLSEESVTEYFNGSSKTLVTKYTYDSYNNIINKKVVENAANVPQRNVSEVASVFLSSPFLNLFNLPSQITNKENDIVKDKKVMTYDFSSVFPQLKKIESYPKGDMNLNNRKTHYDLYDEKGNLLQYHYENGMTTCVIWGYNKTLPIAKLENMLYSNILPTSIITDLQNKSNLDIDSTSENVLKTLLNSLRASFPSAMITTYTHNPLVGVTTITDPKGNTATFSYDTLGRLQNIKDKTGNILSENQYNYKP